MKQLFLEKLLIFIALVIACLLNTRRADAQLTITSGAQLVVSGNLQLTLSNTDLVNNGSLSPGSGTISFTGSSSSSIGGTQANHFYILRVNKSGGGKLVLLDSVSIGQQINFTSGLLDLNGFDVDLGSTGSLNGEKESSHIVGANGGTVIFNTTLNAPSSANPGNLGLLITSTQNLGNTVIRRGHRAQVNNPGPGNSILRYFDILPANNTALNATLRFPYLQEELNGLDEDSLILWEKQAAQGWSRLGTDSHDTGANYVEKTAIPSFALFTLSSTSTPLPVIFTGFDAHCNGNSVLLNWKTAQEKNSHYFSVERSADAAHWIVLGNVAAAGNATAETSYSFADNSPAGNDYYRIVEYDLDGKEQVTKELHTACGVRQAFSIWPNPVDDRLYISMTVAAGGEVIIKLLDGKGALIRLQREVLLTGNNLLSVDVKGIAAGLYYIAVVSGNRPIQIQKLIKK